MSATEPMAAKRETRSAATLNACSANHWLCPLLILLRVMYIVTGKYTVSGQKATEPSKPTTALKNGSIIAISVVRTTKAVRNTSLHRVNLNDLIAYTLWKNADSGHLFASHSSYFA